MALRLPNLRQRSAQPLVGGWRPRRTENPPDRSGLGLSRRLVFVPRHIRKHTGSSVRSSSWPLPDLIIGTGLAQMNNQRHDCTDATCPAGEPAAHAWRFVAAEKPRHPVGRVGSALPGSTLTITVITARGGAF